MSLGGDPFPAGSVCICPDTHGSKLGDIKQVCGDGIYLVKFPDIDVAEFVRRYQMKIPSASVTESTDETSVEHDDTHDALPRQMQNQYSHADDRVWADGFSVAGYLTEPVGLRYHGYGYNTRNADKRDFWVAQEMARADAAERERQQQFYTGSAARDAHTDVADLPHTSEATDALQQYMAEHVLAQQRRKDEEEDLKRSEALALNLQVNDDQYRDQQSNFDEKLAYQMNANLEADELRQTNQAKEQVVEDAFFAAGKRLTRNAKKQHLHQ